MANPQGQGETTEDPAHGKTTHTPEAERMNRSVFDDPDTRITPHGSLSPSGFFQTFDTPYTRVRLGQEEHIQPAGIAKTSRLSPKDFASHAELAGNGAGINTTRRRLARATPPLPRGEICERSGVMRLMPQPKLKTSGDLHD
jgi:hypothetical protein